MLLDVSVASHALEQLRAKYREMLSMRLAHASGDESETDARERMAELATRFPGSLRELDELELDAIRERIGQLDRALRGEQQTEPWMEAVALYHGLARGALWAKRWLAGRKAIDPSTTSAFERDASRAPIAAEALAWTDHLADIAAPPRGRITDLVFARIAQAMGTSESEARSLVFGVIRADRQRRPT
jgi:hypothetical protein